MSKKKYKKYANKDEAAKARIENSKVYNKRFAKKRKKRYKEDKEYRESVREQCRENYKRNNPDYSNKDHVRPIHCYTQNLDEIDLFCSDHKVGDKKISALSIKQLADFLGISDKKIFAWIRDNKFPRPFLTVDSCSYPKYSKSFAKQCAIQLDKGLAGFKYFSPNNKHLITKLKNLSK